MSIQEVGRTKVEKLGNGFAFILLGSSTWSDSEIEFQEYFFHFYEEMGSVHLKDKKVALFGCGDSSYESFYGAIEQRISQIKRAQHKK